MSKLKKPTKGVTLIEVLLYLALFSLLLSSVVYFFFATDQNNLKSKALVQSNNAKIFLHEHFTLTLLEADVVDLVDSDLGQNPSQLVLNQNGNDLTYFISQGRLLLNREGENFFLTDSNMNVESFIVDEILGKDDQVVGVKVYLQIKSKFDKQVFTTLDGGYTLQ